VPIYVQKPVRQSGVWTGLVDWTGVLDCSPDW